MKRLALFTLSPFFLFTFLALMPFASASAQSHNIVFTAPIRTDRGSVQMAFRMKEEDSPFVAIGYEEYSHPAIPATTKGEIFVPDSVAASNGRYLSVCWVSRGSFQGCKRLTKIHLPFNISTISDLAFQGCDSLREVTLPDSLTIIYPQA
ncbi:MAG: leucine-rich repeat protein, partial [Bacteroidaceae bacterium]|nr:leucine-rich repeat protein [Bacteroidaceae bacterium]